jgi:uncharacterized phage protein (TIGR01671 family)
MGNTLPILLRIYDSVTKTFRVEAYGAALTNIVITQRFTGLVDKNGREIYEGDLVDFTIPDITHGPETDYEKAAEVWYDNEIAAFCFGRYKDGSGMDFSYTMLDCIDSKSFEIVGNIFQGVTKS